MNGFLNQDTLWLIAVSAVVLLVCFPVCSGEGIANTLIIWISQAVVYIGIFFACFMLGSFLSSSEPFEGGFCLFVSLIYIAFHYSAFLFLVGLGKKS